MNRFAQLKYGEVVYIYETELTRNQLTQIFAPGCIWFDVTNTDVEVGYKILFNGAENRFEYIPPSELPTDFESLKRIKLEEIDLQTRQCIIGGFVSTAKGREYIYDSTDTDQSTLRTMYIASQSPDFATTEPYNGQIPIRVIRKGETEKVVLGHNKSEMQKLMDDMALHIGVCKQRGWELQAAVAAAETREDLDAIRWDR